MPVAMEEEGLGMLERNIGGALVIPAKAGIQATDHWIPAFAGMTLALGVGRDQRPLIRSRMAKRAGQSACTRSIGRGRGSPQISAASSSAATGVAVSPRE